jgi:hypothetical protein
VGYLNRHRPSFVNLCLFILFGLPPTQVYVFSSTPISWANFLLCSHLIICIPLFIILLIDLSPCKLQNYGLPTITISDGANSSVVGWGTMLQARRSQVRFPKRSLVFFFNWCNPSSRTMAMESTPRLTEIRTWRLILVSKSILTGQEVWWAPQLVWTLWRN